MEKHSNVCAIQAFQPNLLREEQNPLRKIQMSLCFVQKLVFWNKGTQDEELWCSFIANPPESLINTGILSCSSPPHTWELQSTQPRVAGVSLENTGNIYGCWMPGEGVRKPTLSLFSLKGENKEQDKRLGISEEHSQLTPRITGSPNPVFRHHSGIISSGHNLILSRMIWKRRYWVCLWKSSFREGKCPLKSEGVFSKSSWETFLQVIREWPKIGMSGAS